MKSYNINLWITLVYISVKHLPSADSLQCFECENCPTIDEDAKDYIKECTPLESNYSTQGLESATNFITSTTNNGGTRTSWEADQSSTPSSTTIGLGKNSTNASSPLASSTSITLSSLTSLNKTETTQKSQFSSSEVATTKSSAESTTEKQKVTSSWSMFPNSIEKNELSNLKPSELDNRSDELFNWRSRQASEVCYVLKLNYDGHEITKRGCGLRGQTKDQTCQILGKGEPNSECEVCEGNLCNSGSKLRTAVIDLLLILFVFKTLI